MTTSQTGVLIILLINVITFFMFWWDKNAARKGNWRVSENRLLGLALIGGSIGAVAAQRFLRHKTRKEPFRSLLLRICALHITALIAWLSAPLWTPAALALVTSLTH